MNDNKNPKTSLSQREMILKHMEEGHTITPLEALEYFGSLRLGARIAEIKKMGYPVKDKFVKTKTGKHVKAFYIEGTHEDN